MAKRKKRRKNPEGEGAGFSGAQGAQGGEVSFMPIVVVGGLAALALFLFFREKQPPRLSSALR